MASFRDVPKGESYIMNTLENRQAGELSSPFVNAIWTNRDIFIIVYPAVQIWEFFVNRRGLRLVN